MLAGVHFLTWRRPGVLVTMRDVPWQHRQRPPSGAGDTPDVPVHTERDEAP